MEHGTRAAYRAGCGCIQCAAANATYEQQRRTRPAPAFIDAGPACAHLAMLRAGGMGVAQIARSCGVSERWLWSLAAGTRPTIHQETADRILATALRPALGASVPGGDTWFRIRWLLKEGFTRATLARTLGCEDGRFRVARKRIRLRTALRLKRLYRVSLEDHDALAQD